MTKKINSLYVEEMIIERKYILTKYSKQRIRSLFYKIKLLIIRKRIRGGYK